MLILELLSLLYLKFPFNKTHDHPPSQLPPAPLPPSLKLFSDVPDVPHQGAGTSLQAPGAQGQLGVELLHVGDLGEGRQSVGAPTQQEVTEGSLSGGHVWREEAVLNLERFEKKK